VDEYGVADDAQFLPGYAQFLQKKYHAKVSTNFS
jgi:hypothetical protein